MGNGRRSGHQKKIDTVHWIAQTGGALVLGSGVSVAVQMFNAQHLPETLMRTRGEWAASLDGVQAPGAACVVTAGICIVPEGTGTTVLWSPQTDSDAPWIWWDTMHLLYEEAVTDVIAMGTSSGRRVIDSKAMRKSRNHEVQLVVENTALVTSPNLNVFTNMRCLFGS